MRSGGDGELWRGGVRFLERLRSNLQPTPACGSPAPRGWGSLAAEGLALPRTRGGRPPPACPRSPLRGRVPLIFCLPGPVRPGHSPVHACELIALAPFSSGSIPLGLSDPPLPGASLPDSATRRGGTEEFGRAAEGGGGAGQQPFASAGRLPREGGTSREFLSDQRGKFPRSGRGRDCEVRRVHLSQDGWVLPGSWRRQPSGGALRPCSVLGYPRSDQTLPGQGPWEWAHLPGATSSFRGRGEARDPSAGSCRTAGE